MCGRFALKAPKAELIDYFDLAACDDYPVRYIRRAHGRLALRIGRPKRAHSARFARSLNDDRCQLSSSPAAAASSRVARVARH